MKGIINHKTLFTQDVEDFYTGYELVMINR
jgi:hypothetical protein